MVKDLQRMILQFLLREHMEMRFVSAIGALFMLCLTVDVEGM